MLECTVISFNRTNVELKRVLATKEVADIVCFNRTNVELKLGTILQEPMQ